MDEHIEFTHKSGAIIAIDNKPSFGVDGFWVRLYVEMTASFPVWIHKPMTERVSLGAVKVEKWYHEPEIVYQDYSFPSKKEIVLSILFDEAIKHTRTRWPDEERLGIGGMGATDYVRSMKNVVVDRESVRLRHYIPLKVEKRERLWA